MKTEWPGYEEMIEFIKQTPQTMVPGLLIQLVETSYEKKVFIDGGASRTVKNVEKRIGKRG